jgi:hypothetical protein
MTDNPFKTAPPQGKFSLKNMTPAERLEWANSNNHEVNAERARSGLFPIKWVLVDGHLKIDRA